MKAIKPIIGRLIVGCVLALSLSLPAVSNAQTLQFTNVAASSDGGIVLSWQSQSNRVYRIEHADAITEPMDWQELHYDYPSHGMTTFWKDVGNDYNFPQARHPRDFAMRFYRVVETGLNDTNKPSVSLLTPTNASTLFGDIPVSLAITSSISVEDVRIYVDGGEALWASYDTTNFMLNTCQFPNGTRALFAVVRNSTGAETTEQALPYNGNVGLSSFRSVVFDNFISEFSSSSRFINSDVAETIRFRAKFADYADWILTITNSSGVTVWTNSGTGFKLDYVWDGTGNGAVTLPVDDYTAILSASTSSQSAPMQSSSSYTMKGAVAEDDEYYYIKMPPLPPPLDKGEPQLHKFRKRPPAESTKSSEASPAVIEEANGPTPASGISQTTVLVPTIILGIKGTIAMGYQSHHPGGTTFPFNTGPDDGLFGQVSLNVTPGSYPALPSLKRIWQGFNYVMGRNGFRLVYSGIDDKLKPSHLRSPQHGGTSEFNKANIGFLFGHGVYGTDPDYNISASGPLQTYIPIWQTGNNYYDWVRISECSFGSADLRWMCILSCNNMQADAYDDMWDKEVLPINDDLHLWLGSKTTSYMVSRFGVDFGNALTGTVPSFTQRRTVKEAWFFAGTTTQGTLNPSQPVVLRVAGWDNCFGDDLVNYQSPNSGNPGDIIYEDRQVFP